MRLKRRYQLQVDNAGVETLPIASSSLRSEQAYNKPSYNETEETLPIASIKKAFLNRGRNI